jgi:surface carbohydrate biosynthesis protein (TIGR04326 family)
LRAFIDPRELTAPERERRPVPDRLAVNGSGAGELLRGSGFPADRLVITEALRYPHLEGIERASGRALLVVTGFRRSEAIRQLELLADVAHRGVLERYDHILLKPHPFCAVDSLLPDSLRSRCVVTNDPLPVLWRRAAAAFVANSTSAVAEALCLGVPTAVCSPLGEMNLSPAFGRRGVPMVSSAAALEAFLRGPSVAPWPDDFLVVERGLPRWRQILTA